MGNNVFCIVEVLGRVNLNLFHKCIDNLTESIEFNYIFQTLDVRSRWLKCKPEGCEKMTSTLQTFGLLTEQSGAGSGRNHCATGDILESISPVDGRALGKIRRATETDYEQLISRATEAFAVWRNVPAPRRGDIVRQMGEALRHRKKDLAEMITLEVGKIPVEAEGEVQEMIDMTDFAVGQSRMLYGLTTHSERAEHRMYEQWHPLGPVGVITAFNFPVAVWAWNAMIALICGNTVIWKPSSKAAMTALATMKVIWPVLERNGLPEGILNLVIGDRQSVGELLIHDKRLPLISATGSVRMGRHIGRAVASRLGKSILELGGNNAIIITPSANLDLAVRAVVFGAVGTAGQRCTTTRRLMVHKNIYKDFKAVLVKAYQQVGVGSPLEKGTLMGPLIDPAAVENMQNALDALKKQGGRIVYGGEKLSGGIFDTGTYVTPCICEALPDLPVVSEETFAPILYVSRYDDLEKALSWHNAVPQGLSSAIFTNDLREAELFLSHRGSDCGIANVNIGTSGAEIGGAFGGEKDTGGGREAGSDAWKSYMRRQTNTINWSRELPLAQGIEFDIN
jgi:aldehyde dehydrogenase (NAD+)